MGLPDGQESSACWRSVKGTEGSKGEQSLSMDYEAEKGGTSLLAFASFITQRKQGVS